MAKNFSKSLMAKRFEEVTKTAMIDTSVVAVKLIENTALIDYPNIGDISYTADLEASIKEIGFTDPIEVTDYGQPEAQYMIISGHRRRAAGVKCGMILFPCIIKSFDSENDVQNYVLFANNQRDRSKDQLLYCRLYKLHEQHLESIGFKGSVREEIAKRLGVSLPQVDRYNRMNKIIPTVWDLVRDGIAGMSSVLPMSSLSREVQYELLEILKKYVEDGIELTREKIKITVRDYKKSNNSTNNHGDDLEKRECGKHLNMREKQQIIEKRNNGRKLKDIAEDFNISDTAVKRILRLYKNGEDLEPKIENRGRKPQNQYDKYKEDIIDLISKNPKIALIELSKLLKINLSVSRMGVVMKKLGFFKKNPRTAWEKRF